MASKEDERASGPLRDARGRLLPGHTANPKGRTKGTKNRYTQLKDVFLDALEEVGGKDFVVRIAKADPKTFLTLVAKMLPRQNEVKLSDEIEPVPIVLEQLQQDSVGTSQDTKVNSGE